MMNLLAKTLLTTALVGVLTAPATASDIFLSFGGLGEGDATASTTESADIGETGTLYVWVSDDFQIDTGAFLDVANSNTDVVHFTASTALNADIAVSGTPINTRWESFGGGAVTDGLVDELNGFRFLGGTGILPSQVTGSAVEDTLHDVDSAAFLFAAIDYEVVGPGEAEFSLSMGDGLIVNGGLLLSPEYGSALLTVVPEPAAAALLLPALALLRRRR